MNCVGRIWTQNTLQSEKSNVFSVKTKLLLGIVDGIYFFHRILHCVHRSSTWPIFSWVCCNYSISPVFLLPMIISAHVLILCSLILRCTCYMSNLCMKMLDILVISCYFSFPLSERKKNWMKKLLLAMVRSHVR